MSGGRGAVSGGRGVAITGVAFASPFGTGPDALWRGLCEGPTPLRRYEPLPGLTCEAALLDGADEAPPERAHALAADLIARTLAAAGLAEPPAGCGLAIGSHWAENDFFTVPPRAPPAPLLAALSARFALGGPVVNTPVACAASNTAIAWAIDRLAAGDAPCMLAGGFDVVGPTAVAGYRMFDNLTHELPRPFDLRRDGFLLGEGGAVFFLEPLASARAAGRRVIAVLGGAGLGHDAAHPTRPAPEGRGLRRALERALAEAELSPAAIGYVNAHAPGTLANDGAEAAALCAVFGPRGVPVSSTKAALGHAQGGANALELVACLLALDRQELPPTLHLGEPDPALRLDLVAGGPRRAPLAHAASSACSLGGASAVVIVSRSAPWA